MQRDLNKAASLATRLAMVAAILMASGAIAQEAEKPFVVGAAARAAADSARAVPIPDLTGYWKLDRSRSSVPMTAEQRAEMRAARDRRRGRGGGAGRRPRRPGDLALVRPNDRGGVGRLPDLMHLTQTGTLLSFEDSTGSVVQEVTTSGTADSLVAATGAIRLSGTWSGGRLAIERPAWRGGKVTETLGLEDAGTMVIDVKVETDGTMPGREFKRVYQKVTEW